MSLFDDLVNGVTTESSIRAKALSLATSAGLLVTDWIVGAVSQQMLEAMIAIAFQYTSNETIIVRGFASLDTATDPGDPDAFDPNNINLEPTPGFLSNMGANFFGTTREGETFATGFWTFNNTAGLVPRTFGPRGLTLTWTGGSPPSPAPTYHNAADPSIYTNPDGTVTVSAGASLVIPIEADAIGIGSNAPASTISLTTTLLGVTGTNAAAVLGTDREDPDTYRERCRQADARLSLAGPTDAFRYLAAKNLDGSPLVNANGDPSSITKIYASEDSSIGRIDLYFASPSGPAISDDVDAANENILAQAYVDADAINIGPGLPGGFAATATSIHVVGTAKIRAKDAALGAAAIKQKIVDALTAAFASDVFNPIGGLDQTSGAGFIYTTDIRAAAAVSFPGLYDVLVTTPAGASTAIALGHVATLNSTTADWSLTIV